MSVIVPTWVQRQRVASVLLAIVFLGMELAWFLLAGFLLVLRMRWQLEDAGPWLGASLAALALSSWGLARTVKNGHFLWQYGRWNAQDGPGAAPEMILSQARQAFRDGDDERVVLLAGKLGPSERGLELTAGLGRSLALLGRLDEAAEAFAGQASEAESLRWLRPRRAWGMDWPVYFKPADARWARRHVWLVLLAALSVAAGLQVLGRSIDLAGSQANQAFDRQGFKVLQQGAFTVYYHDDGFRDQVLTLAEEAVSKELAFLDREDAKIPNGAMRLYLCETREEYLQRAPYAPSWEQASALPASDSIYIHRLPPDERIYFESVLAHEVCHLLYHRFFPISGDDAWLNEGLADYLGYAFALDRAGFARQAWLQKNRFNGLADRSLPFDHFFQTDPHALGSSEDVRTFYRQGFSLVFLLVEHYGRKDFLRFLDAYRHKQGDATAALAAVYPSIQSTADLAAVWGLYYEKSAP